MEDLTTEDVLSSFQADFGTPEQPAPEQNAQQGESPAPAPSNDDNATEGQQTTPPPAQPEEQTETPAPAPAQDNKAFAAMRIQNKQLNEVLAMLAKQQGIEGKPEEVLQKLKEQAVLEQAKKDGVPDAVAKELSVLRDKQAQYDTFQTQQLARVGFQKVKTDFNLAPQDLENFANQLVAEGVDPFRQALDLPMEYLKRNFAAEIKKAEARGAAAEAARQNKVTMQSSTPVTKTSVNNGAPTINSGKIDNVKSFEAWLDENKL